MGPPTVLDGLSLVEQQHLHTTPACDFDSASRLHRYSPPFWFMIAQLGQDRFDGASDGRGRRHANVQNRQNVALRKYLLEISLCE